MRTRVTATDTLPPNWTYDPGTTTIVFPTGPNGHADPTVTPNAGGDVLSWTGLGILTPGQHVTVTYDATPSLAAQTTPGNRADQSAHEHRVLDVDRRLRSDRHVVRPLHERKRDCAGVHRAGRPADHQEPHRQLRCRRQRHLHVERAQNKVPRRRRARSWSPTRSRRASPMCPPPGTSWTCLFVVGHGDVHVRQRSGKRRHREPDQPRGVDAVEHARRHGDRQHGVGDIAHLRQQSQQQQQHRSHDDRRPAPTCRSPRATWELHRRRLWDLHHPRAEPRAK